MQIISFLMLLLDVFVDAEGPRPADTPSADGTNLTALENPWGVPPWPKSH